MKTLFLLLVSFGLFPALGEEPGDQAEHLITSKSVGFIKFGMTLGEIRKVLPKGYKLGPAPGDEGYTAIGIYEGEKLLLDIGFWNGSQHVREEDLPPLDINMKVEEIDIMDSRYRTAEGVRVGMTIAEAEEKYGKLKEMFMLTHLGEAGTFIKQPEYLWFIFKAGEGERMAGVYGETRDESEEDGGYSPPRAVRYTTGATIGMIRVSVPEP